MVPSPWLTFRQAREALRAGRPEEAQRLVDPLAAAGYRKAVRITREVAAAYLARAEKHLRAERPDSAWPDLLAAEAVAPGRADSAKLRHTLTRLGLAACRAALEAGHPLAVVEDAVRLRERLVRDVELDRLEAAAQEWLLAADQADRGEFGLAAVTLARGRGLVSATPMLANGLDRFAAAVAERRARFEKAVRALNAAHDGGRWEDALRSADEAVAAAPDHREARALRARAWAALQPAPQTYTWAGDPADVMVPLAVAAGGGRATPPRAARPAPSTHLYTPTDVGPTPLPKRFLLWIDGVGGYLVCLSPRVTFGQAVNEGPVDVPLFAELSRLHAELTRDGEGYVFESRRDALVNGQPADRAVLRHGDRLTLGATCQLSFHLPVPISPTARLQLASGHRLPLAVDGVLLMAEAVVMGAGEQAHVPLPPDAPEPVVIHRTKDGLGVRLPGEFAVDNAPALNRAALPLPSVVTSPLLTFAVEPVGPRM